MPIGTTSIALSDDARLYGFREAILQSILNRLERFTPIQPYLHILRDRTCTAPNARKMTGEVAYIRDLWMRGDLRGRGIAQIVTRVAHGVTSRCGLLISYVRWHAGEWTRGTWRNTTIMRNRASLSASISCLGVSDGVAPGDVMRRIGIDLLAECSDRHLRNQKRVRSV